MGVQKTGTLPAVAETDAEDTGSAAESADRALHHFRNLGDGRPGRGAANARGRPIVSRLTSRHRPQARLRRNEKGKGRTISPMSDMLMKKIHSP